MSKERATRYMLAAQSHAAETPLGPAAAATRSVAARGQPTPAADVRAEDPRIAEILAGTQAEIIEEMREFSGRLPSRAISLKGLGAHQRRLSWSAS
jgi:hypothetical protein